MQIALGQKQILKNLAVALHDMLTPHFEKLAQNECLWVEYCEPDEKGYYKKHRVPAPAFVDNLWTAFLYELQNSNESLLDNFAEDTPLTVQYIGLFFDQMQKFNKGVLPLWQLNDFIESVCFTDRLDSFDTAFDISCNQNAEYAENLVDLESVIFVATLNAFYKMRDN